MADGGWRMADGRWQMADGEAYSATPSPALPGCLQPRRDCLRGSGPARYLRRCLVENPHAPAAHPGPSVGPASFTSEPLSRRALRSQPLRSCHHAAVTISST
ncbi:hypothetical protein DGM98_02350 [Xanthomonas citri]|nr:hypothetical protein DGM98_02350 [Xanthomonas citri]